MEMEQWYDGHETVDSYYFDEHEETDNEYDIIEALIESRTNAKNLETEIDVIRTNIISTCKNNTPNNLYSLKISYTEISDKLEKEQLKFNELLNNLNENDFITNNVTYTSEIIENTSVHSDTQSQQSEEQYHSDTQEPEPEIQSNQAPEIPNKLDWNISAESTPEIKAKSSTVSENIIKTSNARKRRLRRKKANIKNMTNIRPNISKTNVKLVKSKPKPKSRPKTKSKSNANPKQIKSKNKIIKNDKSIYTSTLLFCKETFNANETELRKYLIDCAQWNNSAIENIIFKTGTYNNYALIRIRTDMKCINNGIELINEYYYNDAIQIFQRYKNGNNNNGNMHIKPCNVLYVNNFDILGKNSVKKLNNLFGKYGELERDIKIGIDRINDPYAIVYFKKLKDAKKCFEKELVFGGKVLSVKFSKFG